MFTVNIRAHHGMCLYLFEGKGYSSKFCENMFSVKNSLPGSKVKIIKQTDVICSACPNNKNGRCLSYEKVKAYDEALMKLCGIKENEVISYDEFIDRVQKNIINADLRHKICAGCQWEGLCSDIEKRLSGVKHDY